MSFSERVLEKNRIQIISDGFSASATLNESPTALEIWKQLPIEGRVSTWGDEIYFEIPVLAEQEPSARSEVEVGEIGYWPVGHAFCIFFGPTPASVDMRPRAYSPVNIVGSVIDGIENLRNFSAGKIITVDRIS